MSGAGRVSLVGAGPGDPGLLTLHGKRCLEGADVVIYDALSSPGLLALTRPSCEIVFTGKHGSGARLTQTQITAAMLAHAQAGRWVVRLKGGDPFVFGRGGEEALACVRAGIPFEVVPGVTAAVAAPAYAGIPLTHRDHASVVSLVTGHEAEREGSNAVPWDALARQGGTLVLYMSVLRLAANLASLTAAGLDPATPAAAIRWGTTARQRVVRGTVATLPGLVAAAALRPPALVVIGGVVGLAPELSWFERRPLFGRRIVVTRPREQVRAFAALLEAEGAEVVSLPTIAPAPPQSFAACDAALADLGRYAWLVLTSPHGVEVFFERLRALGRDVRELAGVAIAAIGPATAAGVAARGLNVALTPGEYRAEAVADAIVARGVAGVRVLLARAAGARSVLPERLRAAGALVDDVATYRTVVPPEATAAPALFAGTRRPDLVTFTSSSTVAHFAGLFPGRDLRAVLAGVAVGCIGPVTAATARERGLTVDVEPSEYTVPAFAAAIVDYLRSRPSDSAH
ncbi:MAG: uroporphyrinogen-III C-methyltransferase [Polyangiaceae bacterium UTPRO1]|nr:uroporphyrinogen-III C-methyltransferase [Myxococcales bacterium]OQY65637.1 MAG: uroporphyrinogen-III C-methyltransferase [Polyangiaceae bacterium UTPRO1]